MATKFIAAALIWVARSLSCFRANFCCDEEPHLGGGCEYCFSNCCANVNDNCGWDLSHGAYHKCANALSPQLAAENLFFRRDSGTTTLGYASFFKHAYYQLPDFICQLDQCTITQAPAQSSPDISSSFVQTVAGSFTFDTAGLSTFSASSIYDFSCNSVNFKTFKTKQFTLGFGDYCAGIVFSSLSAAGLFVNQHDSAFSSVRRVTRALSDFIGFMDSLNICKLENCVVNLENQGSCLDTAINSDEVSWIQATISGSQVEFAIDTSSPRAQVNVCLRCFTNELSPVKVTSGMFQVGVAGFDCTPTFTLSSIQNVLANPEVTPLATFKVVVASYWTTSQPKECAPVGFELLASGAVDSSANLEVDQANGNLKVDTNVLASKPNLQIRINLKNAKSIVTNSFQVQVACSAVLNYEAAIDSGQHIVQEVHSDKTKNQLAFSLLPLTLKQGVCAIDRLEIHADPASGTPACFTQASIPTQATAATSFFCSDAITVTDHFFVLKVIFQSGATSWLSVAGSPIQFNLKVVCGPASASLSEVLT